MTKKGFIRKLNEVQEFLFSAFKKYSQRSEVNISLNYKCCFSFGNSSENIPTRKRLMRAIK